MKTQAYGYLMDSKAPCLSIVLYTSWILFRTPSHRSSISKLFCASARLRQLYYTHRLAFTPSQLVLTVDSAQAMRFPR